MVFKVLKRLEKTGDLSVLMRAGLISTKLNTYRDVYDDYVKNVQGGMSKMDALYKTSIDKKVSEGLIYRAKNLMEK